MKVSDLIKNPSNPRTIQDESFDRLVKSIQEFPKMMELRPIVIDEKGMVLGGNMRLTAIQHLGFVEIPDTWVKAADTLTEDEKRRFIIADNVAGGEWDTERLQAEWDATELKEWGLNIAWPAPDSGFEASGIKLQDKFIIPPLTVLDTRQGYWRDRKRHWKELIGDSGESRENLIFKGGGKSDGVTAKLLSLNASNGVSLLDPVLAEIITRWFGLEGGAAFDCFAGDTVFGFVNAYLGQSFTGIELRQEQVDLNNQRVNDMSAKYICDDGQNVGLHIQPQSQDLLFSCPPYFDLEVYSDKDNDASNQKTYADFIAILDTAFRAAIECLRDNRFACIVVGDIRDKKGFYYRFVDDIKNIFERCNVPLYNELILVEPVGTTALRAGQSMKTRKVAKTHQNILVFYKGDPGKIKDIFPIIDFSDIPEEDANEGPNF